MSNRFIHVAVLAALLSGCAVYRAPYVQFEAEHNLRLHGLFPATVTGVDDRYVNAGETPPMTPGIHVLTVEMRLTQDAARPVPKTLRVDAKACTRYYIASRKSPEGPFVAVVSHEEPIKECQAG